MNLVSPTPIQSTSFVHFFLFLSALGRMRGSISSFVLQQHRPRTRINKGSEAQVVIENNSHLQQSGALFADECVVEQIGIDIDLNQCRMEKHNITRNRFNKVLFDSESNLVRV